MVNLYIREIKETYANSPNNLLLVLKDINPGLGGFFRRWLQDQKTATTNSFTTRTASVFLFLFAYAKGPIRQDELGHLLNFIDPNRQESIPALLDIFSRLLYGTAHDGYSLAHPAMANYLLDDAEENQIAGFLEIRIKFELQSVFPRWGKQLLERSVLGESERFPFPKYLRENLVSHVTLDEPVPENDNLELILKDSWQQMRIHEDGNYANYNVDLQCVHAAYNRILSGLDNKQVEPNVVQKNLLRCVLLRSSIRSLGTNIPLELIRELLDLPLSSRPLAIRKILGIISLFPQESKKVECLSELANHLTESLLNEFLDSVHLVKSEHDKFTILKSVFSSKNLNSNKSRTTLLESISRLKLTNSQIVYFLVSIVSWIPRDHLGDLFEAIHKIATPKEIITTYLTWKEILSREERSEYLLLAQTAARELLEKRTDFETLLSFSPELESQDKLNFSRVLLHCIKESLGSEPDNSIGSANHLSIGLEDPLVTSLRLLQFLSTDDARSHLIAVSTTLQPFQNYQTISIALTGLAKNVEKCNTEDLQLLAFYDNLLVMSSHKLLILVAQFFDSDSLQIALDHARNVTPLHQRFKLLIGLCQYLNEPEKSAVKAYALTQFFDFCEIGSNDTKGGIAPGEKADLFLDFAENSEGSKKKELLCNAFEVAKNELIIPGWHYFLPRMIRLCVDSNEDGLCLAVLEVMKYCFGTHWEFGCDTLVEICDFIPDVYLPKILEVIAEIELDEFKAQALINIAQYLPASIVAQAMDIASDLSHVYHRERALCSLSHYLANIDERSRVIRQALAATGEIGDLADGLMCAVDVSVSMEDF